ncbi:very short patch repair endonuclease [Rhizobium sp. S9]|uniref:very short patch repair endonuclease n=1 Tax=unclassified Rhizobium TaxID=2613769 RepID=UPI000A27239D|nr:MULTISPECIES: DNA mismatch endonuclease Vsr [unclassified Rhizobium]PDS98985.1 very short patch repair endonuclease [Rhizobium sp. S9]
MDRFSPSERSRIMSAVRGRDTRPEMRVRRVAHALGLRFRLHRKDLPGVPDLVFPKHRLVLFVHGCFWHRHEGCPRASIPQSRREFWIEKLTKNVTRDQRVKAVLEEIGWRVEVIWECETKRDDLIRERITAIPTFAATQRIEPPSIKSGPNKCRQYPNRAPNER